VFHTGGLVAGLCCLLSGIFGIVAPGDGVKVNFEIFMISMYSAVFGFMIAFLEVWQPSWFSRLFGFYDTMVGRGVFILLTSCLALGHTGLQKFLGALGLIVALLYIILAALIRFNVVKPDSEQLRKFNLQDVTVLPNPLWKGSVGAAEAGKNEPLAEGGYAPPQPAPPSGPKPLNVNTPPVPQAEEVPEEGVEQVGEEEEVFEMNSQHDDEGGAVIEVANNEDSNTLRKPPHHRPTRTEEQINILEAKGPPARPPPPPAPGGARDASDEENI